MLRKMLLYLLSFTALLTTFSAALACEFQFELTLPDGSVQRVTPDREVAR